MAELNEVSRRLLDYARRTTSLDNVEEIESPNWGKATRWDWAWYVSDFVREIWSELSIESKLIACIDAIAEANRDDTGD